MFCGGQKQQQNKAMKATSNWNKTQQDSQVQEKKRSRHVVTCTQGTTGMCRVRKEAVIISVAAVVVVVFVFVDDNNIFNYNNGNSN
jgi:Flp pilus assembly protein TadB